METTPLVHSVLHATRLLELYAAQRKESLSLTEISQALGLHKTTVYRLLRTLQYAGWIEQSAKSSRYRLGTGILLVASAVSVHNTTREILSEEMHRLANQFNETVVLSVLLGHTGICADMAKSRHTLGLARERGYLVPLDQGASGKTFWPPSPRNSGTVLSRKSVGTGPSSGCSRTSCSTFSRPVIAFPKEKWTRELPQ